MKFDWSIIPVVLASLAPLFAFVAAVLWDRRQRKRVEKPPQAEKLLRPPGYSLSIRLEKTSDAVLLELLKAFFLGSVACAVALVFYRLLTARAPVV